MRDPASVWTGEFGREYTKRNTFSSDDLDALYVARYGITRTALNREFLGDLSLESVLEIGCNVGQQLRHVREVTDANLTGLDLQADALARARSSVPSGTFVQGDARRLPFADASFDLVFTSAVLIHIAPDQLEDVLREICRCSRRYVWGLEYFSETPVEVAYRGHGGLLWKRDFAGKYVAGHPGLRRVRERRLPYLQEPLVDSMFLLEKA